MSRRCLRCGSTYEGDARFCPKDGNALVDVGTGAGPQSGTGAATGVRKVVVPPPSAKAELEKAGSLSNQVLDGRYQITKKLGEGGMSYVYLAKEISGDQVVAVKVLSPKLGKDESSVERLRREAGLAMRLDHPNVCRIMRLGETEDGLIYLVMPYLKGELLSDMEVKVGPMTPDMGIPIVAQVSAGLHHAHQLDIVHRDLKPENVMVVTEADGSLHAVVMDFGLAKEKKASPGIAKLTATGIILGTPEFMSPEQIRGKPLDARSDIYALGILAFEMFTGKLPFQGRNAQEMMIARLRGTATPLRQYRPDLPEKLEKTLAKSMETNADNRYATALEFGQVLAQSLENKGLFDKLKSVLQ
jgi:serine/threonine-protein kinase